MGGKVREVDMLSGEKVIRLEDVQQEAYLKLKIPSLATSGTETWLFVPEVKGVSFWQRLITYLGQHFHGQFIRGSKMS